MNKHLLKLTALALITIGLFAAPSQADFVMCITGVNCNGTVNNDIIMGTATGGGISASDGDDVIFGGDGPELMNGGTGNDFMSGGLASDELFGNAGNDILLPGPDDLILTQIASGNADNDKIITFVGETAYCLLILDAGGQDSVQLLGFGPYVAEKPFGQPGFGDGFIIVPDSIAGGVISIAVHEDDDVGIETVYGLPAPNAVIVDAGNQPPECTT